MKHLHTKTPPPRFFSAPPVSAHHSDFIDALKYIAKHCEHGVATRCSRRVWQEFSVRFQPLDLGIFCFPKKFLQKIT